MKDLDFCQRLRNARERSGFTQEQLEKKTGIPRGVISFYETGSRSPGLDNIKSLCRGLGCTATELLGI
jgi:transcriptional regulator with XRE-family HTH domain